MKMYDEKFWVAAAFVLFVATMYKILKKVICSSLDSKIATIKEDLNRSEKLKAEAEEILREVKEKQAIINNNAEKILRNADTKIANLESASKENIGQEIAKKAEAVKKDFQSEKDKFFSNLSQNIIENVFKTVETIVEKQSSDFANDYNNKSVEELKRKNL